VKRIICVGLNHRSAPVELREKIAFTTEQVERALQEIRALDGVKEAILVSTCNRVELYAAGDPDTVPYHLTSFLHRFHGVDEGVLDDYLFRIVGEDAISHLFRVAASLDAIVVGEPQILGQVKDAYFKAAGIGTTGATLNRAFHRAFNVAKRVRTETAIAQSAVSVSYAGVELARKIFGDLAGLKCLLVGAGEMGELAARHFIERGATLLVANRSYERAHRLAETYGGVARELTELPALLEDVDIVLCSTSAPGFVITKEMMKKAAKSRRYRPIFLIDIAVPRDIDPGVGDLDAVFCYDVDDLAQVVEENLETRRSESERAEEIVRDEVLAFAKKTRELRAVPTIKALRERLLAVAEAEVEKTLGILANTANPKQQASVRAMATAIVSKALHTPIAKLKESSLKGGEDGADLLGAVAELFELAIDEEADEGTSTEKVLAEADAAEDALDSDAVEAKLEARRAQFARS
jgi:glutamyl-tRNA reductase